MWGRRGPVAAIALQSMIAVALILLVGFLLNPAKGFEALVIGVSPIYWGLCLLTGLGIFVLRINDRNATRPYKIPFYPLPAVVLCASCALLVYSSTTYAGWLTLIGAVPLAVGGVVWLVARAPAAD
jgi:amino acid transporter